MREKIGIGKVVCRWLLSGRSRRISGGFDFIESMCQIICILQECRAISEQSCLPCAHRVRDWRPTVLPVFWVVAGEEQHHRKKN